MYSIHSFFSKYAFFMIVNHLANVLILYELKCNCRKLEYLEETTFYEVAYINVDITCFSFECKVYLV